MKVFFAIITLLFPLLSMGQVQLTPTVIGANGNYSEATFGSISATTGECITTTLQPGGKILTQGFQQPTASITLKTTAQNTTCAGGEDGMAVTTVIKGMDKGPFTYLWTPSGQTTDTAKYLAEGKYVVKVTDRRGMFKLDSVVVGSDSPEQCALKIYSGFSPNSDGKNDVWWIDNIKLYPNNEVMIFTRWGDKVWENKGYDNESIVWTGSNKNGTELPSGTYFYLVTVNGKKYEGWVEITR